jgi:hypothetical protein
MNYNKFWQYGSTVVDVVYALTTTGIAELLQTDEDSVYNLSADKTFALAERALGPKPGYVVVAAHYDYDDGEEYFTHADFVYMTDAVCDALEHVGTIAIERDCTTMAILPFDIAIELFGPEGTGKYRPADLGQFPYTAADTGEFLVAMPGYNRVGERGYVTDNGDIYMFADVSMFSMPVKVGKEQ